MHNCRTDLRCERPNGAALGMAVRTCSERRGQDDVEFCELPFHRGPPGIHFEIPMQTRIGARALKTRLRCLRPRPSRNLTALPPISDRSASVALILEQRGFEPPAPLRCSTPARATASERLRSL